MISEWWFWNALGAKNSYPLKFINWFLLYMDLLIWMSILPEMTNNKAADHFRLFFCRRRGLKQLRVASGYISLRVYVPLKTKRSIKNGSKNTSLAISIIETTRPLLTLTAHHTVKITVRSVSCLRAAGKNLELCGRSCVPTIFRTTKKRQSGGTVWRTSHYYYHYCYYY